MKGHLAPFQLLPAAPTVCQECAVDHAPEHPHNQQSLFYQYRFYDKHGRWPTWADAMAHCSPELQELWKDALRKRGVVIGDALPVDVDGAALANPLPEVGQVCSCSTEGDCDRCLADEAMARAGGL